MKALLHNHRQSGMSLIQVMVLGLIFSGLAYYMQGTLENTHREASLLRFKISKNLLIEKFENDLADPRVCQSILAANTATPNLLTASPASPTGINWLNYATGAFDNFIAPNSVSGLVPEFRFNGFWLENNLSKPGTLAQQNSDGFMNLVVRGTFNGVDGLQEVRIPLQVVGEVGGALPAAGDCIADSLFTNKESQAIQVVRSDIPDSTFLLLEPGNADGQGRLRVYDRQGNIIFSLDNTSGGPQVHFGEFDSNLNNTSTYPNPIRLIFQGSQVNCTGGCS